MDQIVDGRSDAQNLFLIVTVRDMSKTAAGALKQFVAFHHNFVQKGFFQTYYFYNTLM